MLTVTEIEKMVCGLRAQAAQLEATADSLELMLLPLRQQQHMQQSVMDAAQAWITMWQPPSK